MGLFLLCLPWLATGVLFVLLVRLPPPLREAGQSESDKAPSVSVIIPARNEESNIGSCLSSLAASDYPRFEILVVDDESADGTADIALRTPKGNAGTIRLIQGRPLPEGWFGKPWACHQGAAEATGKVLLFTDADTVHAPDLLQKVVLTMHQDRLDVLTLMGRQRMDTFWERLLQPHFFMTLVARFPRTGAPKRPDQWRQAIANGQYLVFWRDAYEALGGHRAVAGEVVEDLRIAQLLVRGGWRLGVRGTEGLETRMYRSLGDLVEGWSKNVATGALQSTTRWLRPFILPLSVAVAAGLWWVPPGMLAWALITGHGGTLLAWTSLTCGFSVAFWGAGSILLKGNPLFGFLYPLGSLVAGFIFIKSWVKGERITWKNRTYEMPREARLGSDREFKG